MNILTNYYDQRPEIKFITNKQLQYITSYSIFTFLIHTITVQYKDFLLTIYHTNKDISIIIQHHDYLLTLIYLKRSYKIV